MTATTLAPPPAPREQAAPASLPHGHGDAELAELDVRPFGGPAPEHRHVQDFVYLTDVENECEHGAVPMDALRGRATCGCHSVTPRPATPAPAREDVQTVREAIEQDRPKPPAPPLLDVLQTPKPRTQVRRKETTMNATTPGTRLPASLALPKTPTPVHRCDQEQFGELPPFLAGMVAEIDAEIARLTTARKRIVEATRG